MRWIALSLMGTLILVPDRPAPFGQSTNDLAVLDGTWAVVSFDWDGGRLSEADIARYPQLIMKAGTWRWTNSTTVGTMTIDPTQSPKAVDFIHGPGAQGGKLQRGIYEIHGDTFRDCIAAADKGRPTAFEIPPGSGQTILVFRRVSP